MVHHMARDWGVRNLSFGSSTDSWNLLRRRSCSPTEQLGGMKAEKATGEYHVVTQETFH